MSLRRRDDDDNKEAVDEQAQCETRGRKPLCRGIFHSQHSCLCYCCCLVLPGTTSAVTATSYPSYSRLMVVYIYGFLSMVMSRCSSCVMIHISMFYLLKSNASSRNTVPLRPMMQNPEDKEAINAQTVGETGREAFFCRGMFYS